MPKDLLQVGPRRSGSIGTAWQFVYLISVDPRLNCIWYQFLLNASKLAEFAISAHDPT
jgi:hypothetical protein